MLIEKNEYKIRFYTKNIIYLKSNKRLLKKNNLIYIFQKLKYYIRYVNKNLFLNKYIEINFNIINKFQKKKQLNIIYGKNISI